MSLVAMWALEMGSLSAAQPAMSISRSGNKVIVSWTSGVGYILQQTSSLAPGRLWTDIGTANPSAPIAITNTPLFFRARSP